MVSGYYIDGHGKRREQLTQHHVFPGLVEIGQVARDSDGIRLLFKTKKMIHARAQHADGIDQAIQ